MKGVVQMKVIIVRFVTAAADCLQDLSSATCFRGAERRTYHSRVTAFKALYWCFTGSFQIIEGFPFIDNSCDLVSNFQLYRWNNAWQLTGVK